MATLKIAHLGPITEANLSFGDLTVLVGPQATGKSIALQMLKLMVDAGHVQAELTRYGLDWSQRLPDFLDVYLGEGMRSLWQEGKSAIRWAGREMDLPQMVRGLRKANGESLFFIPAQRVLALRDGWPRPFTDYTSRDPFAVREFSENLRLLVEREFSATPVIFPQKGRTDEELTKLLSHNVFSGFHLKVDVLRSQKRLVLAREGQGKLPFMVWSAGQREFVPLLLGLYWLMPRSTVNASSQIIAPPTRRPNTEWVVLEELEMGLHARAISAVLLLVFELLRRGYRVCLSSHSPQVVDAVWALKHLRENHASPEHLLEVFGAPPTPSLQHLARTTMEKAVRVYYFDPRKGTARDISGLDPDDEESGEGGLGGLSEFSARANEAVAHAVANAGRGVRR